KNGKVQLIDSIEMVHVVGGDKVVKNIGAQGPFVSSVSGTGKAKFQKVPAGEYTLVIVSANTKSMPDMEKFNHSDLEKYFSPENESARIGMKLAEFQNIKVQTVTLDEGDDSELSHDFGFT